MPANPGVYNGGAPIRGLVSLPATTEMLTVDSSGNMSRQSIPIASFGALTGLPSDNAALQSALDAKLGGSTGSTDNRILRADGTGGSTVQNSAVTIDDSGNISGLGTVGCSSIATSAGVVVGGQLQVVGDIAYGSGSQITWATRGVLRVPTTNIFRFSNASVTAGFSFDTTTNGTATLRNLDNSAAGNLNCGAITASGTSTINSLPAGGGLVLVPSATHNAFYGLRLAASSAGTERAAFLIQPFSGEIMIGANNGGGYYPVIYSNGVARLTFGTSGSLTARYGSTVNDTVALSDVGTLAGQTNAEGTKWQLVTASGADSLRLASTSFVGFNSTGNLNTGSIDASIRRNASGPTLDIWSAGGLRVRNADGSADAPITATRFNWLRPDTALSRRRIMDDGGGGIDLQSNEASNPLFRITYAGTEFPFVVNRTGISSSGNILLTGTFPYYGIQPTGWAGDSFYFQSGVDNNAVGSGNFTTFVNGTTRSFSFVSGNPTTTGRRHLTIDAATSDAVFAGALTTSGDLVGRQVRLTTDGNGNVINTTIGAGAGTAFTLRRGSASTSSALYLYTLLGSERAQVYAAELGLGGTIQAPQVNLVPGNDSLTIRNAARSADGSLMAGAITASGAITGSTKLLFSGTTSSDYGIINATSTRLILGRNSTSDSIMTFGLNPTAGQAGITVRRGEGIDWSGSTSSSEGGGLTAGIRSPSAGVIELTGRDVSFERLALGGVTSLFPSWKRSGTIVQARLADDSAFASVQGKLTTETNYAAGAPTPTGYIVLYDAAGTAYKVPAEAL